MYALFKGHYQQYLQKYKKERFDSFFPALFRWSLSCEIFLRCAKAPVPFLGNPEDDTTAKSDCYVAGGERVAGREERGKAYYCFELAWFVYSGPNCTARENIHKSQLGGMNDNKLYK